jgi:hypothetical protein
MRLTTRSKTTAVLEFTDTKFLSSNLTQVMDVWSHLTDRGLPVDPFPNSGAVLNVQSIKLNINL